MWKQIDDKLHWNTVVSSAASAQFLQSWEWGEFQKTVGRKVLRLSWKDQILIQLIGFPLRFGKFYWYVPRGPVEINSSEKRHAFAELKVLLKNTKAIFVRIDPLKSDFWPFLGKSDFFSVQPQCVRVIDITIPKQEYFQKGIYSKTRYNIRLAERKGVEIRKGEINNFLNLNFQTSNRNHFISHPRNYYIAMEKVLSKNRDKWSDCSVKIWEAVYKGSVIASNIVIYFGDTMTYAHGASSNKFRNIMGPYFLRWKIIEDGVAHGYKHHDLGGVNQEGDNPVFYKKSWEGITQFKKGFGGQVYCYPKSFDLIYKPVWYKVYGLLKKMRNIFFHK